MKMNSSLIRIAIILAATTLALGYPQPQEAMEQTGAARLMVAGGNYWRDGSEIIEVIDIEDENMVCDDLPQFPIKSMFHGMGGLLDGKPVICGGANASDYDDVSDQCYSYDKTRLWKPFAQLDGPRSGGLSHTLDRELFIIGGVSKSAANFDNPIRESVFIFENGTTQKGMKMPVDLTTHYSCSTQFENGTILVIGIIKTATGPAGVTYIVDPLTQEISSGPTLPRKIYNCEAISFKSPAHGGRHVLAILNYGEDPGSSRGSSGFLDILDYTIDANTWKTQRAQRDWDIVGLLTYFDGSNTVLLPAPSGDGFIALKGPPDGYLKEIFQFKCTIIGCEWTEKIRRLKESHNKPVLMYIPNSLTDCRQKTQEEVQLETMIKELMDKRIEIWEEINLLSEKESTTSINERINFLKDANKDIVIKLKEHGECKQCL